MKTKPERDPGLPEAFHLDGSYRDIHVLGTGLEEWRAFLKFVTGSYPTEFLVEYEPRVSHDQAMKPRTAREQLWRELAYLFEEEEYGNLSEVRLIDIPPGAPARILRELLKRAEPLEPTQTIWREELGRDIPMNDVPDLAALLNEEGFHVVLRGIRSHGVRLPDLGVFADPRHVELDYLKGREWNAEVLAAFVELLAELRRLAPGASLDLQETVLENVRENFRRAVETYLGAGSTPTPH